MTTAAVQQAVAPEVPPAEPAPQVAGFRQAFALLRPYRSSMILAFLFGTAAAALAALQPLLVSSTVDGFAGEIPYSAILLLFVLLASSAMLNGLEQYVLQRSGERFAFDTRKRLIQHVYRLPIGVLERRERGDIISRITTDVSQTRAILSSGLVELATSLITVLVSLVMMALIDAVLLVLAALAICMVIVAIYLIGRRTRPAGLRAQNAVGDLAAAVSRSLGAIRTIRATVSTTREADSAVRQAQAALEAGFVVARLRAVVQTFSGVAVQLLLIAVVAAGAIRVAAGSLTVGQLSAFIMYLLLMATPITMFGSLVSLLGEAFGALTRILAIQSVAPESELPDVASDVASPSTAPPVRNTPGAPFFALRNISFRYPQRTENRTEDEVWALRNVTLDFLQGRTTALVGPSGAGKSTLFALLERFYDATEGAVLFRGEDVRRLSRDDLRRQISYVEQDAPALSGTVRDNLLLGLHTASDAQCADALRRVNLLSSADTAADFLDAQVGEVGTLLSGGERQRLAIARAFLADAPILLLDEVTSNLDSNNERVIQDVIRAKNGAQSIIVIAHRLSTVVAADSIIVMEEGKVVAQGTHSELLAISPLYRELAHNQLLD
ncbi:ATP-binding cassette, subfamily B [Sinosporangium album]|uniref:ATP-binding cassette, subfamily B n=1 Tax=Sinosporangium album TaxID=504805 RepID=A0A1G8K3B2_9ACTN|nr:ABC transporter ATP-binding protein [Sinosporangium album]SDI37918.1 ATP-binding cassette, subfamily B [Sinosporangium album]